MRSPRCKRKTGGVNDVEQRLWTAGASERFEMLVTDHDMPRETGLSFVNELRSGSLAMGSNKTDIPVVMVSAKAEPDHVDAVRKAGIQALVQKPFLPTAFVQLLNDIVSSKRSGDFICLSTLN